MTTTRTDSTTGDTNYTTTGANIGKDFGPFGDAAHEFFMGADPSTTITGRSTLTPEQEQLLAQLMSDGRMNTGLSMDGQEALQNQIAQGGVEGLRQAGAGSDGEEMRQQLIAQMAPLQEQAQEQLKTVGREFSGSGFYGSDREAADLNVQQAFAQAQSQVMADLVNSGQDRALQANLGLQQGQLSALGIEQQGTAQQLQAQELLQQLLGVQGTENIVLNEGGTDGQSGGILGGIFSDRRLKYDIRELLMLPLGIPLVSWRWKNSGRWSYGVIAQDLQKVIPEAVIKVGKFLAVDYAKVFKQLAKLWTRG